MTSEENFHTTCKVTVKSELSNCCHYVSSLNSFIIAERRARHVFAEDALS